MDAEDLQAKVDGWYVVKLRTKFSFILMKKNMPCVFKSEAVKPIETFLWKPLTPGLLNIQNIIDSITVFSPD
jgi:hypothetical protein